MGSGSANARRPKRATRERTVCCAWPALFVALLLGSAHTTCSALHADCYTKRRICSFEWLHISYCNFCHCCLTVAAACCSWFAFSVKAWRHQIMQDTLSENSRVTRALYGGQTLSDSDRRIAQELFGKPEVLREEMTWALSMSAKPVW